jgi:hypothetical protein
MHWKIYDETVDMVGRRFGYFPHVFRWQGHRYEIDAVERSWTVTRRGWRRHVERRFFLVRCGEGVFEIFQDLETGIWWLRRARLVSARSLPVRRMAPAWQ